jgi:hypothetical protein
MKRGLHSVKWDPGEVFNFLLVVVRTFKRNNGSIAMVVVPLLCIEVVVLILLLGAQVIVELELRNRASSGDEQSVFDQ